MTISLYQWYHGVRGIFEIMLYLYTWTVRTRIGTRQSAIWYGHTKGGGVASGNTPWYVAVVSWECVRTIVPTHVLEDRGTNGTCSTLVRTRVNESTIGTMPNGMVHVYKYNIISKTT